MTATTRERIRETRAQIERFIAARRAEVIVRQLREQRATYA